MTQFGLTTQDLHSVDGRAELDSAAADLAILPEATDRPDKVETEKDQPVFKHPLGGGSLKISTSPAIDYQLAEEITRSFEGARNSTIGEWERKFILAWRLGPELSSRRAGPTSAYPLVDFRIPDHTIWHRNSLASAFVTCGNKPAFLMFHIGPVQDFIAQSRTTQDLWSASYLISYLIAQGMLGIADEVGPDTIIFPQLRGLPLADFHWFQQGFFGGDRKLRSSHPNELLTPNLPNRFLALVPSDRAHELAQTAAKRVQDTWNRIAKSVENFLGEKIGQGCPGWDRHWSAQIARFPSLGWVVHPWPDCTTAVVQAEQGFPPLHGGWSQHPLRHALRWAGVTMPVSDRSHHAHLNTGSFAWALHFANTEWKFAARKSARTFNQWHQTGPLQHDGVPKDNLDGSNEVIGGPNHEEFWKRMRKNSPKFKGSQVYGALSIIKRLWPDTFLKSELDLDRGKPVFEPVTQIAQIDNAMESEDKEEEVYYAVIALDGDDIGQWVSGAKAARLLNSLSPATENYFRKHWPAASAEVPELDNVRRPVSPSYHAAFSEALANFSLYCTRPIVEGFGGQLIYAGGDDVLAMLPAITALDCAQALQLVFRGLSPEDPKSHASKPVQDLLKSLFDFSRHVDGFVTLRKSERRDVGKADHLKPNWPLMMMGPEASLTAGIAIGHVRSPMQETIQAAREAEKDGKRVEGKGSFHLEILKRSGDRVGFSARWQQSAPAIWSELGLNTHQLSTRFPHRYAQLLKPLLIEGGAPAGARYSARWTEELVELVEAELRHVLRQQGKMDHKSANKLARHFCNHLLGSEPLLSPILQPKDYFHFWLARAFLSRLQGDNFSE